MEEVKVRGGKYCRKGIWNFFDVTSFHFKSSCVTLMGVCRLSKVGLNEEFIICLSCNGDVFILGSVHVDIIPWVSQKCEC